VFNRAIAIAVLSIAVVAGSRIAVASDAKPTAQISGIYSDLYFSREGGDLLGQEIFVVFAGNSGYFAFVQCWQGGTTPPVTVPAQVKGNTLSLDVPAPSLCEGTYTGSITKAGFTGTWSHRLVDGTIQNDPVRLKRKRSYWQ
jgi:hypothetical protein